MKRIIALMLSVIISISIFSSITINANAVGNYGVDLSRECYIPNNSPLNPYSKPQCTWYCWGRTYEKFGISLPSGNSLWRNANTWDESAEASSQYTVGTEARENSILVENSSGTGHVAFVEKVENGYAYISEGNYLGTEYHEDRINLSTMIRDSWSNHVLSPVRYIYLKCKEHKWDKGVTTKQPTCKKNGEKTYTCTVCGETKKETIKASSKYHSYKVSGCVKATLLTNGILIKKCEYCGKTVKPTIYHPKTIKLKKVKYTYKGKAIKPSVVIKNTKGKAISSKYYSVSYKNNKNVGIAKALVQFKTRYSGKSTLKFMIVPKGTSINKFTAGVKSLTVKWKKQSQQASGYQIQYATNSKFSKGKKTVTVINSNVVSKKIKKLKAVTRYYVRVRTYKQVKSIQYYSAWSKTKSIKTKKPADSKDILLGKIKSQTNIDISHTYYADYDGDGKKELFAIAGELGYTNGEKQIWFASTKQVKCLSSGTYMFIYSAKQVKINNKQKMFIAETGAGGSGSTSLWYYVKSSKVKEKPSSSYWCGLTQIKGAEFYSVGQNYDHWTGNGMGGHTYKRYYFKWNGKKFIEYVGTKISKDKLKTYKNASSFLNTIKSLGFKVGTIYKRANGIININIHKSDGNGSTKNENINLKLKNNKVTLIVINKSGKNIIEKSSFGGIYKSKISLEPY